ncbi:hypothetical protein V500_07975 [Pseudogymnoascus sp. VKM F-4518 (FW-2643)]|nr:hypothetical protein V500_07975 [Pseudogymnoascus sp. VKM F-4518 (FW-2643)]
MAQQGSGIMPALEEFSGGNTSLLAQYLLEEIYVDYHVKHFLFIAAPERRLVPTVRWSKAMRTRINNLLDGVSGLQRDNLVFVAILSISPAFMDALMYSTDDVWAIFTGLLRENKSSIEFFARSRGLPWLQAVRELIPGTHHRDPERFLSIFNDNVVAHYPTPNSISDEVLHRNLNDYGPDTFYLSLTGTIVPILAPSYNDAQRSDLQVIDIKDCIYDHTLFSQYRRTWEWPWEIWPRHPQLCKLRDVEDARGGPIFCQKCGHLFTGEEGWHDADIGCQCHDWCANALIQIVEYPPFPQEPGVVNRGVRALQSFDVLTAIGEYTGLLVPNGPYDPNSAICDNTYLFTLIEPGRTDNIAYISARLHGNWTRFINHTDDKAKQNVEFSHIRIMNRLRIVVVVIKKIDFGDQILGHYGDTYFQSRRA